MVNSYRKEFARQERIHSIKSRQRATSSRGDKQDFIKEYVTFFSEQRQEAFIRAGMLIRIDTIFYTTTTTQNQGVTDVSYNSGI